MVKRHQLGLAKKVSYRQDLASCPGKDASLDSEVKPADITVLGFMGKGNRSEPLQKSWGPIRETEAQQEAFKGIHGIDHSEWGDTTVTK